MKIKFLLSALLVTVLFSCQKEDAGPDSPSGSGKVIADGVMVLNEGQFNTSNASITLYSDSGEVSDGLFQAKNGKVLGDVLHSVGESESNYYFVVNNSGKIEVVGKNDFKSVATISGFKSPRYFLNMGNGKALVSNFIYDSADVDMNLDLVDLNSNTIVNSIKVNNWCEMMHMKGENIYVANSGKDKLLIIDKSTLTIKKEIDTPPEPVYMVEDKNGYLWLSCNGEYLKTRASLVKFNTSTNTIEQTFEFSENFTPQRLAISNDGSMLYVLNGGVYEMPVDASSLSIALMYETIADGYAYGLGINPDNGDIYVSDAKDFAAKGLVKVFDSKGKLKDNFSVGVAPNGFLFQ